MYGGQQFFPVATPGYGTNAPTIQSGVTVEQYAAIVAMHALLSNPNYTPNTYSEMAQKAKEVATTLVNVI
jgi:hypothetical protein